MPIALPEMVARRLLDHCLARGEMVESSGAVNESTIRSVSFNDSTHPTTSGYVTVPSRGLILHCADYAWATVRFATVRAWREARTISREGAAP